MLIAGASAVCSIVALSLNRDFYFYYSDEDIPKWRHPTVAVAFLIGAAVLETAAAYWVLGATPLRRAWVRALLAMIPLSLWGAILVPGVIHAPRFYLAHLIWVWGLLTSLGVAALLFGGVHAYSLLRDRVQ